MFGYNKIKAYVGDIDRVQHRRYCENKEENTRTQNELYALSLRVSAMSKRLDSICGHVQALTSHLGLEAEILEKDTIILKTKEETKNG